MRATSASCLCAAAYHAGKTAGRLVRREGGKKKKQKKKMMTKKKFVGVVCVEVCGGVGMMCAIERRRERESG